MVLEISTTFPRLGCLTPFLAKNYQPFQRLGNFSNKYDNLCHKFLFLSINGVSSHFIATLLLQNMEHLVKSLPYYLKSQENWQLLQQFLLFLTCCFWLKVAITAHIGSICESTAWKLAIISLKSLIFANNT